MLTRKTKLWIFISAASVILASAAAVVFTKPELFKSCTWKLSGGGCGGAPAMGTAAQPEISLSPVISSQSTITLSGSSRARIDYAPGEKKQIGSMIFSETGTRPVDITNGTKLNSVTLKLTCSDCSSAELTAARAYVSLDVGVEIPGRPSAHVSTATKTIGGGSIVNFINLRSDPSHIPVDIPRSPDVLDVRIFFEPLANFPQGKTFTLEALPLSIRFYNWFSRIFRYENGTLIRSDGFTAASPAPPDFSIGKMQITGGGAINIPLPPDDSILPIPEDTWTCGSWNACNAAGTQTRTCTKTFDSPAVDTPSPLTSQSCTPPATPPPAISITISGEDTNPPLTFREGQEQLVGVMNISETGAPNSPRPALREVSITLVCANCAVGETGQAEVKLKSTFVTPGGTDSTPPLTVRSGNTVTFTGFPPGFATAIGKSPIQSGYEWYVKPLAGFPRNRIFSLHIKNVATNVKFSNATGATITHTHVERIPHPAQTYLIGGFTVPSTKLVASADIPSPIGSEIHVRRSVDTPVAASFQPGAQGNVFKVRAFVPLGQPNAEIESITFSKFGTTRNRDFDEIRLYEGDRRFESGVQKVLGDIPGVVNAGYVNFRVDRILRAGETATFTLWMKLESDALIDSTFYFSIPYPDEVTPADSVDIVVLEDRDGSRCVGDDPNCVRSENFIVAREEVAFVEPPPSCTLDTWSCGSWDACTLSGTQSRSCVKTFDCTTANTPSPATSQSCTPDEEPEPTLSGLTCEQQDLFTYTGEERSGRTPGMCIPCRTNLYVATGGTCDLGIGDEEPPAEEEPAPAPTLQSAPRIVQAPERSDSGPGVLVYFAAMGVANLALFLKKRKKK